MKLQGKIVIASQWVEGEEKMVPAISPLDRSTLEPLFHHASSRQAVLAAKAAGEAFTEYSRRDAATRARFLEAIAGRIEALGDALIQRAHLETGLPLPRLVNERGRTCGQLRLFAEVVREGSWVDARIDTALPDRQPLPRPDLRRMLVPLGPVVVFGSSNFPLAFSVAGGDTASALAAGNPVVVKAHSAHPGTAELVASAVIEAVQECGLPGGTFSMLHGSGRSVGIELVKQPQIKAVGFTGSHVAGRALFDAAAARPDPIPVFAEMSSLNPVFVLPRLLEKNGPAFAHALVNSVTLSVGQVCTKPGLIFGLRGEAWDAMLREFSRLLESTAPATMLSEGIHDAYYGNKARLCGKTNLRLLAESHQKADPAKTEGVPAAAIINASDFLADAEFGETEVFGPFCLFVAADSPEQLAGAVQKISGQLTISIHHAGENDQKLAGELAILAAEKSGRLVFNGFPTGVEVCAAMNHGGPYPSTSDVRFTSVGTAAMLRFTRPLCWQNCPDSMLPEELQSSNPRRIMRLVDGQLSRDPRGC